MSRRATATKEAQPDLLGKVSAPIQQNPKTKAKEKAEPIAKVATTRGELTVVKNTPTNTLAVLTKALSGKNAQNLQIVAALHKEMVAEQSRLDYIEAKRQMKRKLPIINKDGKIEYKDKGDGRGKPKPVLFASYENLHDCCSDPMFEYGFDITHVAQPGVPGMINVVTTLVHTNGHFEQSVLPMPHDASGGKSGAQGWASAFSFGKRINMIGLLDIVTRAPQDRDLDGNKPKVTKGGKPQVIDGDVLVENGTITQSDDDGIPKITQKQQDELIEALEGKHVTRKKFCEVYKLDKVSNLPAERFTEVMQYVKAFVPKGA